MSQVRALLVYYGFMAIAVWLAMKTVRYFWVYPWSRQHFWRRAGSLKAIWYAYLGVAAITIIHALVVVHPAVLNYLYFSVFMFFRAKNCHTELEIFNAHAHLVELEEEQKKLLEQYPDLKEEEDE